MQKKLLPLQRWLLFYYMGYAFKLLWSRHPAIYCLRSLYSQIPIRIYENLYFCLTGFVADEIFLCFSGLYRKFGSNNIFSAYPFSFWNFRSNQKLKINCHFLAELKSKIIITMETSIRVGTSNDYIAEKRSC